MLRQLGEAVQKYTNSLHVFILTKLMMPVRGKMMFKMADLVVYGPLGGKVWPSSTQRVVSYWFHFPPHPTHALAAHGDTQGSGTGKDGVFPATGESRGCMEYYVPTSVTPKAGGLHARSVSTGIASQLTRIGSHIIMG